MIKKENNFAYIDGANLHQGVSSLGWKLDYKKFRVWLSEKYKISKAYIFIGLIPQNKELYQYLQECNFILIFKEVVYSAGGKPKGNCDADLVVSVMRDTYENKFYKMLIVTSDGDYASLVVFLQEKEKLIAILSPSNPKKCSILLKRTAEKIAYISDQHTHLMSVSKEKTPDGDKIP